MDSRLVKMHVPRFGLSGPLAAMTSLGRLTVLRRVDLSDNRLTGPIPFATFARIGALAHLNLSGNNLTVAVAVHFVLF